MGWFGSPDALARLELRCAHAGSVELKALLEPPAALVAEALTGRANPTWSVRQMYLLDTARLDLVGSGVEVRLRGRTRGRHDLCVSARRHDESPERAVPRGARVEFDVVPGGLWQDIEVRRDVDAHAAADVIDGVVAPGVLLSDAQRTWAREGGQETVQDDQIQTMLVHGPLVVRRVKVAARRHGLQRAELEHVAYPSGRELLELSTRCAPRELCATAAAFERMLDEQDVAIGQTYRSKAVVWREDVTPGEGGRGA